MPAFEKSVFFNCPFDAQYRGLFQATVFTIQYLGLEARTSYEDSDAGTTRIDKLLKLIRASKYGIHDLSRCQAEKAGEFQRMNMPLELGIDYGCKRYGGSKLARKKLLVLDSKLYRLKKVVSDLSGSDFRAHKNTQKEIIRVVSDWLAHIAKVKGRSPKEINAKFEDFRGENYKKLAREGYSKNDIEKQSAEILRRAMRVWIRRNKPTHPAI